MLCLCLAFLVYPNMSASGAVPYLMVILITAKGPCFRGRGERKALMSLIIRILVVTVFAPTSTRLS